MQSVSTLCVNVFHAARGYLLISHARLSISAIATPQRSIYRPPTIAIAVRFFLSNDLFGPLYLEIIGSNKLLFIIDLASHRIVPFPFHCELNCPPATPARLTGHCLSIIMLSVICFHAPLKHFQFHSRAKQPKAPQRVSSQLVLHYLNYDSIKFQSKINELPISRTHTRTHLYTCILGLCNAVFVAYVAQFACVS